MDKLIHIEGKNKGKIILYGLSTCIWCKKTKQLLDEIGVDYYYVFVDQLGDEERKKIIDEIKKWNPQCSFPTTVINDNKCITGFKEDKLVEELGR